MTRSVWWRVRNRAARLAVTAWLRPDRSVPCDRLGTGYGAWSVPTQALGERALCYCVGVGEDTQLDIELMRRGHEVHAFDPTPRAIVHAGTVVEEWPQYAFEPIGLWSQDTVVRFYQPADPAHVSHSIVNLQRTGEYFEAPVERLSTVMERLGHDHLDLLKIDIEGAEHEVLADVVEQDIRPRVLCVEFDQPTRIRRVMATSRMLRAAGYRAVDVDGWNVTWVLDTSTR